MSDDRTPERSSKARCAHKGCGKIVWVKPGFAGHPCCDDCFERVHRPALEAEGRALDALFAVPDGGPRGVDTVDTTLAEPGPLVISYEIR